ncbi:ATP-binding protein [Nakamurella sp. YIM 132087]|uniref:ATP-binding protein n=1 Tax=Nakamurella alba TaxID=2665158 RepID=A0A7K1FS12_9ACTN|nr:ATP-binding protein [Nakamurella alba]MTD16932.1 ATP-binding protein [Nakamurella alba]
MTDPARRLARLARDPSLRGTLLDHAARGVAVQLVLRAVLAVFVVLVVLLVPPTDDSVVCRVIGLGYAAVALGLTVPLLRPSLGATRHGWMLLFLDLVALAAVSVIAGRSEQTWTDDILVNGFFLLPVLAATQLRPWVCLWVSVPTVALYLGVGLASQEANTEPTLSVLLRTGVLAGVCAGCLLLARLQRSRVLAIGDLVAERAGLSAELLAIEGREQRELSETLHDGALQYVLAARQDLEDARDGDTVALDRIEHALAESAGLLRSTVSQLHPAVLERGGLGPALTDLARSVGGGRGPEITVTVSGPDRKTPADGLLLSTARELLTNAVRHSGAGTVHLALDLDPERAVLTVTDDGKGIADGVLEQRIAEGHIGLASRRVRLAAVGGALEIAPGVPQGTVVTARVPLDRA